MHFEWQDQAQFETCGIMIDCSRNAVPHVETIQSLIRMCSLMGLNTCQLYTEDTFELKEESLFGYCRGRYSRDDFKRMDDYAFQFGIELFACIQVLFLFSHLCRRSDIWDKSCNGLDFLPSKTPTKSCSLNPKTRIISLKK